RVAARLCAPRAGGRDGPDGRQLARACGLLYDARFLPRADAPLLRRRRGTRALAPGRRRAARAGALAKGGPRVASARDRRREDTRRPAHVAPRPGRTCAGLSVLPHPHPPGGGATRCSPSWSTLPAKRRHVRLEVASKAC